MWNNCKTGYPLSVKRITGQMPVGVSSSYIGLKARYWEEIENWNI